MCSVPEYLTQKSDDSVLVNEKKAARVSRALLWNTRNINSQLLTLIQQNKAQEVYQKLEEGAVPGALCRINRLSTIHIAALVGAVEILQTLLERGVSPYLVDKYGRTALHLASWMGEHRCVQILASFHKKYMQNNPLEDIEVNTRYLDFTTADVNYVINEGKECLDSKEHNCLQLENFVIQFAVGSTALHVASSYLQYKTVEALVEAGASIDCCDGRGLKCIDVVGENITEFDDQDATNESAFESIIKHLLSKGTKFTKTNQKYNSPLHVAVRLRALNSITEFLEHGYPLSQYNESGNTPVHVAILFHLENSLKRLLDLSSDALTLKSEIGCSPLQLAVEIQWSIGIGLLLKAGADVTQSSKDGSTVLHKAAVTGNTDLLEEILELDGMYQIINKENSNGETPLFSAITSGVTACTELLVYYHASTDMKLPGNITVLHRAAEYGHHEILRYLLEEDSKRKLNLINQHDNLHTSGMTPLHMAAFNNHSKCVRELLQMNCRLEERTTKEPYSYSQAIHLGARKGHHEVIREIAGFSSGVVFEKDGNGWNALQIAAYYGHREAVKELVRVGADLVQPKHEEYGSPLQMIMKNVTRPTELLESVFDECITINDFPITNTECEIVIDYSALIPTGHGSEQMLVLKELLKSRNRYHERRLLLHPVVESFLHKKWKALGPFFYAIILLYTIFVCTLTLYATSIYFRKDFSDFTRSFLVILLFMSILMITMGEVLYGIKNFRKYMREIETWVKLGSFFLALLVVSSDHTRAPPNDWPRHITALSILLAWTELMFLLSRFPNWGYYVQMFFKVTSNVIKVLLTFLFLVIGFALSFMLEFQGDEPFSSPIKSLVKTVVMMASEFDYGSLFEGKSDEKSQLVFLIGNVLFVIFLVLASIVLMNLMVGLAVNDIQDLEIQGKINRLVKQVDFLSALDSDNLINLLPVNIMKRLKKIKNVEPTMVIYPGRPKRSQHTHLPGAIYNSIIELALKRRINEECDVKTSTEELSARMDEVNIKIDSILQILEDIKRKQY